MDKLYGSQVATVTSVPDGLPDYRGVQLAGKLGIHLDGWQADVVADAGRTDRTGNWAAREVCAIVPRQNGKTYITLARILAGALLYGEKLILYSAQHHKTAREMWMTLRPYFDQYPLNEWAHIPSDQERREQINFHNGCRFRMFARNRGAFAIRGQSPDVIIYDEAFALTEEMTAAAIPATAARERAQIWYLSSAGTFDSFALLKLRQRGHSRVAPGLAYWEWFADNDADHRDPLIHAAANPAYGRRLMPIAVQTELESMSKKAFQRERLGVWQESAIEPVLSEETVNALTVPMPRPPEDGRQIGWGVDVAADRSMTSITAAFFDDRGIPIVVEVEARPGAGWMPERLGELLYRYGAEPVAYDARGGLVDLMERVERDYDMPLMPLRYAEYPTACAAFAQRVAERKLQFGQSPMLIFDAINACARQLPTGWVWDRRTPTPPTHLVSATCALYALENNAGGSAVKVL